MLRYFSMHLSSAEQKNGKEKKHKKVDIYYIIENNFFICWRTSNEGKLLDFFQRKGK